MAKLDHQALVAAVTEFYFDSGDFNGYPVYQLKAEFGLSDAGVATLLSELISANLVDVVFGNMDPNPHIKAFADVSIEDQLEFLSKLELSDHSCLYPSPAVLASSPRTQEYEGRPYSKALALGSGQLDFRAFDLSVLEHYRNDPRYSYWNDWINGRISIRDEYSETGAVPKRDQVLLQTFGIAYDDNLNRAIAVFVRYLHPLSPEHQRLWEAKELNGRYKLHPDYFRNSILGECETRLSIFEAFLQELSLINEMASTMGKPPLFREEFKEKEPKDFGFLLRPTLAEFNKFVHLLDKMMSDNLNKDFFGDDAALEEYDERSDGKIIVRQVGTIQLLERWLAKHFRLRDPIPLQEMLRTFRRVRQARQRPAHVIDEDKFDQKYFHEQQHLIIDSYAAIRTIRLILANHRKVRAKPPEIDEHLRKGEIWHR